MKNKKVYFICTWFGWILRNHDPIGIAGKTSSERQIAAMSTHDLHDEASLMTRRRGHDGIDSLDDAVQSRVGANGHVRAAKVVVDRAHETDDVQVRVLRALFLGYLAGSEQLVEQRCPFAFEHVRAGQATVATDTHQVVDATFN